MQVLIYEPSYARIAERLTTAFPSVEVLVMQRDGSVWLRGKEVAPDAVSISAAWANTDLYAGGPVRDFMILLLRSPTLRWVQSSAAGFDHPVFSMLVDKGVMLSNSHASAPGIAEFVLAAVLDCYQPQAARRELQSQHKWQRTAFREISGGTWLIVGMGHIGSEVAIRARAFGAHVLGVRRSPTGNEPADEMLRPNQLRDAAARADVLVVAAASNQDSLHLIDAAVLARMKPGSVLVNIARGALVDEAALLASLERGIPEHTVLDVFATEPLPSESPLWTHPRVRLSAHCAAASDGLLRRNDQLFLDNLARLVRHEQPTHVVDPEVVRGSVQGNAG
jgi:phosphoglycerate dehydrogenase-like enzyme